MEDTTWNRPTAALTAAMRGTIHESENRISRLLFKLAVELDMVMNVLAAGMDIPQEDLEYLLRLEDPLAVVRDQWASRQECDPSHEFKEMLVELQDNQTLERVYPLDADWTPERSGPSMC